MSFKQKIRIIKINKKKVYKKNKIFKKLIY